MSAPLNQFRNSDAYVNVLIEAGCQYNNGTISSIASAAGTTNDIARTVLVDYQTQQRVEYNNAMGTSHDTFVAASQSYNSSHPNAGQAYIDKAANWGANVAKHK